MRHLGMRLSRILARAALAVGMVGSSVNAQGYPAQTVRFVVPSAPGGGIDLLTRTLAAELGEEWPQTIIVENKQGANGVLGTADVAQAPADGYTLLTVTTGFVTNPTLYDSLPYETLKDFTPITVIGTTPLVLVANPDAAFTDAKALSTTPGRTPAT